jgi:hypothetical protein
MERGLKRRAAFAIGLVAGLLALAPAAVTSVEAAGTRTDAYPAGPYTVTVTREDPVSVDHRTEFTVALAPADAAGLVAIPLPGAGTDARPGRAATAVAQRPGVYQVSVTFPVRGAWVLALAVAGPAGSGQAAVPVTVAAPGAIPTWLGWAIGLSPLAGLVAFLAVQVRTARRLRSEHP